MLLKPKPYIQFPSVQTLFFIKEGNEFIYFSEYTVGSRWTLKDAAKIVSANNYCLVFKTLKAIEAELNVYQFIRIHKPYNVSI